MPRNLYPSHTGRFGGLNRQLMMARERLGRFRDHSQGGYGYGYGNQYGRRRYGPYGQLEPEFQQMPQGVAGEEFVPEAYESSPMWADVEQQLHETLRNPPKYQMQPGEDPEALAQQEHWQMIHAPGVLQGRERNKAVLEAARIAAGGKTDVKAEKEFQNAMAIVKGKEKILFDMKKANQAKPGTFTDEDMQTALEAYTGALRAAHRKGEKAGWEGLEESYPEIAPSGLTKATQAEMDRKEAARAEARKRQAAPAMDPYGNIVMGELGLPDIFPGGIPNVKAVEALQRVGAKLDEQLEKNEITKESYDKKVKAITAAKTAEERVRIAEDQIKGTTAMDALQEFYREQQPPAKLPQSLAGQAGGMPGSDLPGAGIEEMPSPETELLGEGAEQMPAGIPNFLQQGPEQPLGQEPMQQGRQMIREPIDFSGLPPREEIGRVPEVFKRGSKPQRSRRFPFRRSRVREE